MTASACPAVTPPVTPTGFLSESRRESAQSPLAMKKKKTKKDNYRGGGQA